jgi:DNA-binding CsgD family transcriptional regulator
MSPSARNDSAARLTATEAEIARLVTRGLTNREIGDELGIRPKTVGWHLTRIYRKFGVTSRTQLAVRVATAGQMPWAEESHK